MACVQPLLCSGWWAPRPDAVPHLQIRHGLREETDLVLQDQALLPNLAQRAPHAPILREADVLREHERRVDRADRAHRDDQGRARERDHGDHGRAQAARGSQRYPQEGKEVRAREQGPPCPVVRVLAFFSASGAAVG